MNRISVAMALALCVAFSASAQMYKWVDANGKVQYSDKPPPSNIKAEKLREPARAASAPAPTGTKGGAPKDAAKAGPKTPAEQEQAFRKRQMEAAKSQDEAGRKQAEVQERAENCQRARAALVNLQMGGRQMRIDEKGERVFLDDQQVAQETARVQREAAAACN